MFQSLLLTVHCGGKLTAALRTILMHAADDDEHTQHNTREHSLKEYFHYGCAALRVASDSEL